MISFWAILPCFDHIFSFSHLTAHPEQFPEQKFLFFILTICIIANISNVIIMLIVIIVAVFIKFSPYHTSPTAIPNIRTANAIIHAIRH